MEDKLIAAIEAGNMEEARWLVEAILHLKGVSKLESSDGSTKTSAPLSAFDLQILLDTLLATPTSTDQSEGSTWRSKLSSLAKNLPSFKSTDSTSGKSQGRERRGSHQSKRPLHSKRRYWPSDAKSFFWDVVRALNAYDKEMGRKKSPIQLMMAEEVTRREWESDT